MANAEGMKPIAIEATDHWTIATDYDVSNNPIYIGKAKIGSSKASAVWQIRKITYDRNNNATDVQWANGNEVPDKVWEDRINLDYS